MQEVQQGLAQLLRNFDDVQPTLLLFLKKLQCIAITDKTSNHRNSVMLRQQLPNAVVELRHGDQAQHVTKWLVVSQTLQPSVKRLDVEVPETELAVAFELGEQQPRQQQVFAFLPLRKYGLRFIVQVRIGTSQAVRHCHEFELTNSKCSICCSSPCMRRRDY